MICVYVLISEKDHNRYIGSTIDINQRIIKHENGKVLSTKNRRPLRLFAYQECKTIIEARMLEKAYKRSRGKYEKALSKGDLKLFAGCGAVVARAHGVREVGGSNPLTPRLNRSI